MSIAPTFSMPVALTLALANLIVAGCATPPPPPLSTEPLGLQMLRAEPELARQRFVVLLGFESAGDEVFQSGGKIARGTKAKAHTGSAALSINKGEVTIRVAALLGGRALPGGWPMVGAFVYTDGPSKVHARYGGPRTNTTPGEELGTVDQTVQIIELSGRGWQRAMLDISALPDGPGRDIILRFEGPVRWLDDVVLIDNGETLVAPTPGGWRIDRLGRRLVIRGPYGTVREFPFADGSNRPEEVSAGRLILRAPDGALTSIYPDGVTFENGVCMSQPFVAQHDAPADVGVPEWLGEVDRVSTGDANNDGYNETTGTYRVTARGPRVEVTLVPRGVPLARPLIEIVGLPVGDVRATVEGKWVESAWRLPGGAVLVQLPLTVARATTVNVNVQPATASVR